MITSSDPNHRLAAINQLLRLQANNDDDQDAAAPSISSMLAANSSTTPAKVDAVVDSHTVDALARRVEDLEEADSILADNLARVIREYSPQERERAQGGG